MIIFRGSRKVETAVISTTQNDLWGPKFTVESTKRHILKLTKSHQNLEKKKKKRGLRDLLHQSLSNFCAHYQ